MTGDRFISGTGDRFIGGLAIGGLVIGLMWFTGCGLGDIIVRFGLTAPILIDMVGSTAPSFITGDPGDVTGGENWGIEPNGEAKGAGEKGDAGLAANEVAVIVEGGAVIVEGGATRAAGGVGDGTCGGGPSGLI